MCQNYGVAISCNIVVNCVTPNNAKPRVEVTSPCGCCAWTVPANISNIFIEIWGAGGGGGGSGGCDCCTQGVGGAAGGYVAAQISTCPGCVYTLCAAPGGAMGCGACTNGTTGGTSYVAGYNLSSLCALGGFYGCSPPESVPGLCYGFNTGCGGVGQLGSSTYLNNAVCSIGEGGHQFGQPMSCRSENKGGSAPFNGGIGAWMSYSACCPCWFNGPASGGGFPGGGGAGGNVYCCCGSCNCGGCGGGGFVRIWF